MKKLFFTAWLAVGLCISLLWACSQSEWPDSSSINSFAQADDYLRQRLLPHIQMQSELVVDNVAKHQVIPPLDDPIPKLDNFPLYGAKPTQEADTVYVEIFSSIEKGNAKRENERWLVDVAEAFNQKQPRLSSGKQIKVGIRSIASGIAADLLAKQAAKPAGYSPSNELWLELLKQQGGKPIVITPKLVEDCGGFVVDAATYKTLATQGDVTFDRLIDQILGRQLKLGYANPYTSASSLNLLYHILWQAAGHGQDGKPLTIKDVRSPQVASVFDAFQKQVVVTGLSNLELRDTFLQDSSKLQVFALGCRGYSQIKQEQGYENIGFVPYGVPHNNPLVGFDWNTPMQQEALKQFAEFAASAPMQQLATQMGELPPASLMQTQRLPNPSGDVLKMAQALWKKRKDGGRTVYMELVVDTSGSMEQNQRLRAVQDALRFASKSINPGSEVGLITFSDRPIRRINLAPFNELEQKRLFTAIDQLKAEGGTVLYDGLAVGLASLMDKKKLDPDGQFNLLLLTDGERTDGLNFGQMAEVIKQCGVKIYPISYGEVNQQELQAIAATPEGGTVYSGNPETVQTLLKDMFQTNL